MGIPQLVEATPFEEALRASRGVEVEAYTGHAEVWYDRTVRRSGAEVSEGGQAALEDERNFIDFSRSCLWVGKEHVIIDRG